MIYKNEDFTRDEEQKNTFFAHVVLETINKEVFNSKQFKEDNEIDIILTMNGIECDFKKFTDVIESQLDTMIEKRANRMLHEKFDEKLFNTLDEISDVAEDLKERMADKIDKEFKYTWE